MNKFIHGLFVLLVMVLLSAGALLLLFPAAPQPPLPAIYFNANAYLVDAHLPANSVNKFIQEDGLIMTGCVYEWLPDGRSLLVVTPPELTECVEASR